RWKDAFRCCLSRSLAADVWGDGNSESDAVSITCPTCRSESRGEYRVRHGIHRDHDSGDQGWLALLYLFRIDRNDPDGTYRLLDMERTEATNRLIGGERGIPTLDVNRHYVREAVVHTLPSHFFLPALRTFAPLLRCAALILASPAAEM